MGASFRKPEYVSMVAQQVFNAGETARRGTVLHYRRVQETPCSLILALKPLHHWGGSTGVRKVVE